MITWGWAVGLACAALVWAYSDAPKTKEIVSTPNFLVIIADDAGWNDLGYHGSEIKTPNIDFLAGNGVRLNRFYLYPICSPTRASFLTGMPA